MKPALDMLAEKASAVRRDVVRMVSLARSGCLAESLSLVDILVWLYWEVLSVKTEDPTWEDRDRLVLGKGAGSPALYATLANRSFFTREELWSYRRLGAMLQGYPEVRRTPGVDAPGGYSGQGLGLANGMALALSEKKPAPRVFCIAGGEELNEGVFWESAMTSAHFAPDNLLLILCQNGGALKNTDEDLLAAEEGKLSSFGWTVETCDGHDLSSLREGWARLVKREGKPRCLMARTKAGKGISFLEANSSKNAFGLGRDFLDRALRELEKGGK